MKSTTSRSLAPRASCARIWLRRSTARPAFDSASDWFWHTRQRSSAARSMTRLSSDGSSAPATETASNNAKALLAIKFIQQGNQLVAHQLAGDRADALVAAGDAPRGPYVEDPHPALQVLLGERLVGLLQHRQLEVRRRLADQRRGNLARIEPQAERQ